MYRIVEKLDGKFLCEVMIQDGTERWAEYSLKDAKKSVKRAASFFNGTKIKTKDIEIYKEISAPTTFVRVI